MPPLPAGSASWANSSELPGEARVSSARSATTCANAPGSRVAFEAEGMRNGLLLSAASNDNDDPARLGVVGCLRAPVFVALRAGGTEWGCNFRAVVNRGKSTRGPPAAATAPEKGRCLRGREATKGERMYASRPWGPSSRHMSDCLHRLIPCAACCSSSSVGRSSPRPRIHTLCGFDGDGAFGGARRGGPSPPLPAAAPPPPPPCTPAPIAPREAGGVAAK